MFSVCQSKKTVKNRCLLHFVLCGESSLRRGQKKTLTFRISCTTHMFHRHPRSWNCWWTPNWTFTSGCESTKKNPECSVPNYFPCAFGCSFFFGKGRRLCVFFFLNCFCYQRHQLPESRESYVWTLWSSASIWAARFASWSSAPRSIRETIRGPHFIRSNVSVCDVL